MATKNKPAQTFRSKGTKAAIWENTGKDGKFYTVTFTRSYKDVEGNWKETDSYGKSDLNDLSNVARQAEFWILTQK